MEADKLQLEDPATASKRVSNEITRDLPGTDPPPPCTNTNTMLEEDRASKVQPSSVPFCRYFLAFFVVLMATSFTFVHDWVTDTGVLLRTIPPLNTDGCVPIKARGLYGNHDLATLQACEDVHIHRPSSLAFAVCGHAESRKRWFPPVGKFDTLVGESAVRDNLVVYNIETGVASVMELVGFPAEADRVFVGMDIFEDSSTVKSDQSRSKRLIIFLVNHRRTGSVVEVFEYEYTVDFDPHRNNHRVKYLETIEHGLIQTPNDILAMGPRSFYVSNDHFYKNGTMRALEEKLRRPWSNVVYISPEESYIAYEGVVTANGMTSNQDRTRIYLSACHGAALHVLRPGYSDNHKLYIVEYIKLDFYVNNPSFDPETNAVFLAGHIQPFKLLAGLEVSDKPMQGPSKVVKISWAIPADKKHTKKQLAKVETVLQDDGRVISAATVAAIDRGRDALIIGTGFSEHGLWRCPIPAGI
ncbi:hypothetical protein BG011_007650 [Mortierella polycephala]|uniref:Calcium-dependent phosphotriesterase n=1 Tax=Mortierella polycephala TaxID=41804 RepID=A0A9P6UB90_9FUNG|nr:hypothetical protein BG011_007650 [Mortierella polycephala]